MIMHDERKDERKNTLHYKNAAMVLVHHRKLQLLQGQLTLLDCWVNRKGGGPPAERLRGCSVPKPEAANILQIYNIDLR